MPVPLLQQISVNVSPLLVQVLSLPMGCMQLMPQLFQLGLCTINGRLDNA